MKPVYRIYIEVEKVTVNPLSRRDRHVHEDVTLEATDFAFSYQADSWDEVKQAAQAMHDFAQELVTGGDADGIG